jgi:hypothetical protein
MVSDVHDAPELVVVRAIVAPSSVPTATHVPAVGQAIAAITLTPVGIEFSTTQVLPPSLVDTTIGVYQVVIDAKRRTDPSAAKL